MHKRILKIVSSVVGVVVSIVGLAGCGNAAAAEALGSVTQLSGSGIITKDQLKTLQGKTGSYSFVGHDDGITYTWRYDAAQIKNPEDQHLKIDVATTGSALESVKKSASSAPYAVSVKVSKFRLAGSPELIIDVPQKWVANKIKVVTQQDGGLRQLSEASPTIGVSQKKTELTGTVSVTNKTLYFVCGFNRAAPIPSIGEESTTSGESKTSQESQSDSATPEGGAQNTDSGTSADSAAKKTDESATSSSSKSNSSPSEATGSASSSGSATEQKDPNSVSVTVSVDAKTAASHMDQVAGNKKAYVPSNGWIIAPTKITLKKGQTAYDALAAVTKAKKIQMESKWFPVYDAYYVEGINNLYEFDGGPASGWMYSVDGWFPNYGSSQYSSLKDGSVIAWRYTLELGNDVGGGF